MMRLKNRQEHGPESQGVYMVVMAFGKVNREALWDVPEKTGMPGHFVSMPARPHADAAINVKTGEEDRAMSSPIAFLLSCRRRLRQWGSLRPGLPAAPSPME